MLDGFTRPNVLEDRQLLVPTIGRNQDQDRLADDFFCRIAKQAFRAFVPTHNDAIKILAYDRIFGRLDDRNEPLGYVL